MGEKKHISQVKEFHIICVDTLPSRRECVTLHYFMLAACSNFFQRVWCGKGNRKTNFAVEKPDRPHHSQAIKVKINSSKPY